MMPRIDILGLVEPPFRWRRYVLFALELLIATAIYFAVLAIVVVLMSFTLIVLYGGGSCFELC